MDIKEENLLKAVDSYRHAAQQNDLLASAAARLVFEKCLKIIDETRDRDFKASAMANR